MTNWLIVGLGNPGNRFKNTRHNLGVETVYEWADRTDWQMNKKYEAEIKQLNETVTAIFPVTGMNESGRAVAKILKTNWELVVVYDDIELELGEVELQKGGSAKGHNGVRSMIEHLKDGDFWRLRLGVGRPKNHESVSDFVLGKFGWLERGKVKQMKDKAGDDLTVLVGAENN